MGLGGGAKRAWQGTGRPKEGSVAFDKHPRIHVTLGGVAENANEGDTQEPSEAEQTLGFTRLWARGKAYLVRISNMSLLLWPSCFSANLRFLMSWGQRRNLTVQSSNKVIFLSKTSSIQLSE